MLSSISISYFLLLAWKCRRRMYDEVQCYMNPRFFEYFSYVSNQSSYIPEFYCLENNTGLSYYEFVISFLKTEFFHVFGKTIFCPWWKVGRQRNPLSITVNSSNSDISSDFKHLKYIPKFVQTVGVVFLFVIVFPFIFFCPSMHYRYSDDLKS